MESILLNENPNRLFEVYDRQTLSDICGNTHMYPDECYKKSDILKYPKHFKNVKYIFSTWGMPVFTKEEVAKCFPSLKNLFYAAGSVQQFAQSFVENDVTIHSAYKANAIPVIEYTVSQIVLANKLYYQNCAFHSQGNIEASIALKKHIKGNYENTIGIIGAGAIGAGVIERLNAAHNFNILVYDPFLSDEDAAFLKVVKTTLLDLFSRSDVISNHLADNDKTKNILNYPCFKVMKPYSTFINTGRGAQVRESELVKAMNDDPTRTAVLDVTWPEPPEDLSPLYNKPNIFLTSHIAGSMGNEVKRMARYMYVDFFKVLNNYRPDHIITPEMLNTMA